MCTPSSAALCNPGFGSQTNHRKVIFYLKLNGQLKFALTGGRVSPLSFYFIFFIFAVFPLILNVSSQQIWSYSLQVRNYAMQVFLVQATVCLIFLVPFLNGGSSVVALIFLINYPSWNSYRLIYQAYRSVYKPKLYKYVSRWFSLSKNFSCVLLRMETN